MSFGPVKIKECAFNWGYYKDGLQKVKNNVKFEIPGVIVIKYDHLMGEGYRSNEAIQENIIR